LNKPIPGYCADAIMVVINAPAAFVGSPIQRETNMAHPTIMRGSTGQAVKDAQQGLIDRGYTVGPAGVDGVFGNHTYHAVIRYQTDRSVGEFWALSLPLDIDGIVGPQTWSRLAPDTVKKGDSGTGVRLLQSILKDWGDPALDPGPIDGVFGPNTETAVKNFQGLVSLPINGVVDSKNWMYLWS
jgi:peptidoglycan hydrolase-like protein with peptidoglycan-binding domain